MQVRVVVTKVARRISIVFRSVMAVVCVISLTFVVGIMFVVLIANHDLFENSQKVWTAFGGILNAIGLAWVGAVIGRRVRTRVTEEKSSISNALLHVLAQEWLLVLVVWVVGVGALVGSSYLLPIYVVELPVASERGAGDGVQVETVPPGLASFGVQAGLDSTIYRSSPITYRGIHQVIVLRGDGLREGPISVPWSLFYVMRLFPTFVFRMSPIELSPRVVVVTIDLLPLTATGSVLVDGEVVAQLTDRTLRLPENTRYQVVAEAPGDYLRFDQYFLAGTTPETIAVHLTRDEPILGTLRLAAENRFGVAHTDFRVYVDGKFHQPDLEADIVLPPKTYTILLCRRTGLDDVVQVAEKVMTVVSEKTKVDTLEYEDRHDATLCR